MGAHPTQGCSFISENSPGKGEGAEYRPMSPGGGIWKGGRKKSGEFDGIGKRGKMRVNLKFKKGKNKGKKGV